MSQTASDVMVETLYQWGVRVVFGIPGDGINGIIEAFRKPTSATVRISPIIP